MANERYAIWYKPTGDVYQELRTLISQLSQKYDSPIFDPHITLLPGGTDIDKNSVVKKLETLVKKTQPFETTLTNFFHSEEFFKCVFIKVEQTSQPMDFAFAIQKEFLTTPIFSYSPHLSILYGKLSVHERESVLKKLGNMYKKTFIIKEVDIVEYRFGELPETWRTVESLIVR